jgi:hypothetical protein
MLQLKAVLGKNLIEKRRSTAVTCCEFFSHFIILLLLVYGHGLAEITYNPAKHYTTIRAVIPPTTTADFYNFIEGPLPTLTLDTYVGLSRLINPSGSEGGDFSQFSYITEFDNLLYLGTLHFSPDNEDTRSLIEYLNNTYLSFRTLTHRVHASEAAAVSYVLDHLEERTLALVALGEISAEGVRYKLRLNYTTLPNTNTIVNDVSLGLDPTYQKYFTSGFLTFKDAGRFDICCLLLAVRCLHFLSLFICAHHSLCLSLCCCCSGRLGVQLHWSRRRYTE